LALTLLFALAIAAVAVPVGAQSTAPATPAPDVAVTIGHPRAAVLTLHEGAAESFLLPAESNADKPIALHGRSDRVHLVADYEAVFAPLTAGWARYALAAYLVTSSGEQLLDDDLAEVVSFGPARRAGRLGLQLGLKPGLHKVKLVSTTAVRAVGVGSWTVDRDTAVIWVLVPGRGPGSGTDRPAPVKPDLLGDLGVGAQRGIGGAQAIGAIQFETGQNSVLTVRSGQSVRVWSDYELWLSEGARADASVALAVHRRPLPQQAEVAPLASDRHGFRDGVGPRLDAGSLTAEFQFDQPGTYELVALLTTTVRRGDVVATDKDLVPFTVRVVGQPPDHGAIAGQVTGDDGTPLPGVEVAAAERSGTVVGRARTNRDGFYVLRELKPGAYLVHAIPHDINYIGEWFDDKPTMHNADPVRVQRGVTTIGIDFELTPGGTIAGRVVDESGSGIGGIEIAVGMLRESNDAVAPGGAVEPLPPEPSRDGLARAKTNDDGYYSIDRLRKGAYWVRARDPEGKYLTEYFDDKPNFGQADKVWVRAGAVTEGIDFELAPGGSIAGQVREETVLGVIIPIPGALVEARSVDDPTQVLARAVTNRDGRYKLGALRKAKYLVRASDPAGRYVPEWFHEAAGPEDARPVPVKPGEVTEPIDFTLEKAGAATRVFVSPALSTLRVGQQARVTIQVEDVADLAAFETALEWEPGIFDVVAVEIGDFLGSSGRRVIPMEPVIDNATGRLTFGAASLGDQPGASGAGVLFHLGVIGRQVGRTPLRIGSSTLTDPGAQEIEHVVAHGMVRVGECMVGDFDCNCVIDIIDVMAVVHRWGAVEGDPDYDPLYDMDGDGDIDIVDVQIEAGLWGRRCDDEPRPVPGEPGVLSDSALELDDGSGAQADGPLLELARDADAGTARLALPQDLPLLSQQDTPQRPAGASVSLTASPDAPAVGDTVVVAAEITDAGEVAGFELELQFDSGLLRFLDAEIGPFLGSTGRTVMPLGPTVSEGSVSLGALSLPGSDAPSGSGRLARFTFEVIGTGDARVEVTRAIAVDALDNSTTIGGGGVTISVTARGAENSFVPLAVRGH